jgi:tRNA-dihydrouridine synthase B
MRAGLFRRRAQLARGQRSAYTIGKMITAEKLGATVAPALQIGPIALSGRAFLAPMAGVTDAAMRRIAEAFGAGATVSEMISAQGVARGDRETALRLAGGGAGPRIVQIAARDAAGIAAAARCAADHGAQWIDINMGCPCKRVTGGLAGSALMRDLDHAARLIAAARAAVEVPVSVKMRLGWDDAARNAPELAQRAEAEGAALVTVHGRTRQQFYSGAADWDAIRAVKTAVRIPVVANGDCASVEDAAQMLRRSGADAVMIGRAAVGRPWLVGDAAHYLATGRRRAAPALAVRRDLAREHLTALLSAMGARAGLRHARKHLAAYVDHAGLGAARAGLRRRLLTTEEAATAEGLIDEIFLTNESEEAA